ncbi:dihydropteroate synthase [Flaviaesturariibacter amylovorans]|uniref:dihydropteroate synthase n=1 Tax=Flaviaesturariibacter amylovorans TaxID=1084520 RepID=A0ABP8GXV0_9BACT
MTIPYTLNCRGRLLPLEKPAVMGILNATPDSFFAGSRVQQEAELLGRAEEMLLQGATFLDIGGQSTRPGSERVSEEEELARVLPAVIAVCRNFPLALVSIDTFYARVAREAVAAGAVLVNDISAGALDPGMLQAVAELRVPYVLMHMQGDPKTMQGAPQYTDVVTEVFDALNRKLSELRHLGIADVIVDPGFGFGKTIAHNFQLLQRLDFFQELGCPVMVGISRKGTIYKTLGITPEEALNGSTVLHTLALARGANVLRVHDVREAMEAVKLVREVMG